MNDMRRNSIAGIIEHRGLSDEKDISLHFSEWWNGEGLDLTFGEGTNLRPVLGLHLDELHMLVVAAVATGMVDLDSVQTEVKALEKSSDQRQSRIQQLAKLYARGAL